MKVYRDKKDINHYVICHPQDDESNVKHEPFYVELKFGLCLSEEMELQIQKVIEDIDQSEEFSGTKWEEASLKPNHNVLLKDSMDILSNMS